MPETIKDDDLRDIDRDLSQLLAVEPSPEFTAKVRARIQQEPATMFGWRLWTLASVAAVATIVIGVLMVARKAPYEPPAVPVHADLRLPAEAPQPRTLVTERPGTVQQAPRPARTLEPEVLIDPAVARAVRRLAMEQPVFPEVPPEPSLAPVVLEPLRVPDVSEVGSVRLQADQGRR